LISLALTLYNQTDEFILGFLDPSKAAVGAYSVGVKGIDIVITLITSLYAVFMPRATYYYEKEDKRFYRNLLRYSFNIVFFISIPAIATMAAMSGTITSLISGSSASGQYRYADVVLMILSVMMLTYSIGDSIYTEILLPQKKEKVYLIAMAVGVACNVGLSFLLAFTAFKNDPILGVAIATGSTDVVLAVYLMLKTKEYSLEAIWNLNNLKIFISGVLIFLFCFFVCPLIIKALPFNGDSFVYAELIGLVATTLAAAIIYCGTLLLFKEKLVSSFTPKRRKEREAEENA
jgi:O-antigen/teichoic acid export membrane protein